MTKSIRSVTSDKGTGKCKYSNDLNRQMTFNINRNKAQQSLCYWSLMYLIHW